MSCGAVPSRKGSHHFWLQGLRVNRQRKTGVYCAMNNMYEGKKPDRSTDGMPAYLRGLTTPGSLSSCLLLLQNAQLYLPLHTAYFHIN